MYINTENTQSLVLMCCRSTCHIHGGLAWDTVCHQCWNRNIVGLFAGMPAKLNLRQLRRYMYSGGKEWDGLCVCNFSHWNGIPCSTGSYVSGRSLTYENQQHAR